MESEAVKSHADGGSGTKGRRQGVTAAIVRDAAMTVFAERGYHGTALRQIALRLEVQTPSLYNHMASKQELLREIITETTDQVWVDYQAAVHGVADVRDRLRRAITSYALRHAKHRREAIIVNREIMNLEEPARASVLQVRRQHEQAIRSLIIEGVGLQLFRTESPFLASFAMLEMCVSVARWYEQSGPLTAESIANSYGEFALRMVNAVQNNASGSTQR